MSGTVSPCPFYGHEMNKDNTLKWLRDAGDRIIVATASCLSCRHVVGREGEEGGK